MTSTERIRFSFNDLISGVEYLMRQVHGEIHSVIDLSTAESHELITIESKLTKALQQLKD